MADLDRLYGWFNEHRDVLIAEHKGAFVLLKDNSAVAYHQSATNALIDAKERGFTLGDFLVQPCISEAEETITWYSRELV